MKVAVCGGTLSGAVLARLLSRHCSCHLFPSLQDPARTRLHPLCEYAPLTFTIGCDNAFARQLVKSWCDRGWVEQVYDSPVLGSFDAKTKKLERMSTPTGRIRYMPKEGFFNLIHRLMDDLPSSVKVNQEQLLRLQQTPQGTWHLHDTSNGHTDPFDAVVFAYDANPRAARKASMKQLLESALPHAAPLIGSLAGAVSASVMATIVSLDESPSLPRDDVDVLHVKHLPPLQMATRNNPADFSQRGIKAKTDHGVWTLIATPEWSQEKRGKGKWNKPRVGQEMVAALGQVLGVPNLEQKSRSVFPTFHWQGASSITQIRDNVQCFSYDAHARLAFCGDILGGQGVEGAIASAQALASHLETHTDQSNLPSLDDWILRPAQRPWDDDTNVITGPHTGRAAVPGGTDNRLVDDTWPTAVDIARGKRVESADSLAKYRRPRRSRPRKKAVN